MDRLYRTMLADPDERPRTGRSARSLGVRVEGAHADVHPDKDGLVRPGQGGMSVTMDDPALMPPARRPQWLNRGLSEDPLFMIPAGDIETPLAVRIDKGAHALMEPSKQRRLEEYEADLTATRPHWEVQHPWPATEAH